MGISGNHYNFATIYVKMYIQYTMVLEFKSTTSRTEGSDRCPYSEWRNDWIIMQGLNMEGNNFWSYLYC